MMQSLDIESSGVSSVSESKTTLPSITPGHDAVNNITNILNKPDPIVYIGRCFCDLFHCCQNCCHCCCKVITNPWFWRVSPWIGLSGCIMYIVGKLHSIEETVLEIVEEPFNNHMD